MKITEIEVMLVDPGMRDNMAWWPVVCRVHTDEGIYGDGEAALSFGRASHAAYGALIDCAKLVIGMDPFQNEVVWEKLHKSTFWAQNGGPAIWGAISAIDIALWDIKGKALGVPVSTLLGGKFRDKLRTYASQLQGGWCDKRLAVGKTEDYAMWAKVAVDEGYDAVKFDFFTFDLDGRRFCSEETTRMQPLAKVHLVEERCAAVREAVGPDVDIIVENHAYIDAQGAVQFGRALEPYDIFFFEEPCTSTPKMTKFVHDNISIPIAQGERIYTRWGFAPYFENGSVQVIQPDLGTAGGITECMKICAMAHTYDVGVQLHVCSSPLLTAASLQVEACIPNFLIHEHHAYNLHDYNKQMCIYDYQPKDGYFEVPSLPGIGNELSEYVFEHSERTTIR